MLRIKTSYVINWIVVTLYKSLIGDIANHKIIIMNSSSTPLTPAQQHKKDALLFGAGLVSGIALLTLIFHEKMFGYSGLK